MIDNTSEHESNEVTAAAWERRKAFVGFTEDDVKLLRDLHPVAEGYADEVVEDLYKQFLSYDETKAFFTDDATLARVKALQKEYFLALTRGDYGENYLKNRLHIGRVHHRIGLSPRWYMGGYSIYMTLAFPKVLAAFGSNKKKGQDAFMALFKLSMLDKDLAIMTYITAAEDVISAQSHEILAISTPVFRIWEGVIAAPLIGSLDSQRTSQLMEHLLQSIVDTNSSVALLDITGVPVMDTKTSQHLIETVAAGRLLGAQVILTGVRPMIAQTLVHLGVQLTDIVTRPSLAAGLRYAMELLEFRVVTKDGENE